MKARRSRSTGPTRTSITSKPASTCAITPSACGQTTNETDARALFRLADAAEGEHGNVKAAEGKDRVFILTAPGESGRDFISEEDGELVIRFEYRPATLTDWPEDAREGKTKPPTQKDLIALASKRVLAVADLRSPLGSPSSASHTSPRTARRPTTPN